MAEFAFRFTMPVRDRLSQLPSADEISVSVPDYSNFFAIPGLLFSFLSDESRI
jgi:hypothetical protein